MGDVRVKIACVGGGPAGLYFSILMKRVDPSHDITVYERNPAGWTYGWGVTYVDELLKKSAEDIVDEFIKVTNTGRGR